MHYVITIDPPASGPRVLSDGTIQALVDELVELVDPVVTPFPGGFTLVTTSRMFLMELRANSIVYSGMIGSEQALDIVELVCRRTGWIAYDQELRRVVAGAEGAAPPPLGWGDRALVALELRGLIIVRPANRPMVIRALEEVGRSVVDAPAAAVDGFIDFAETDNAVDELFGEADELISVLQTLSR